VKERRRGSRAGDGLSTMDSKLIDPATGKEIRLTSYAACAG
jgi:hypothetical protein